MNKRVGAGMRIGARMIAVGLMLAAMAADVWAASDVRSVRLWRAPDNTRLVFDLSGPVQHSVFTLTAPDRIVIDISGAKLVTPLDKLALRQRSALQARAQRA